MSGVGFYYCPFCGGTTPTIEHVPITMDGRMCQHCHDVIGYPRVGWWAWIRWRLLLAALLAGAAAQRAGWRW